MATWPLTTVNAPLGLQPDRQTARVNNRTGSATVVGEVVQFDLASTTTEVTTIGGGETGVLANVITPVTAGLQFAWYAICTEIAADNAEMEVVIRGKVKALLADTAAAGEGLVAQNGQIDLTPLDTSVDEQKIIAIALETASSDPDLKYCLFDGIYGFGMNKDA